MSESDILNELIKQFDETQKLIDESKNTITKLKNPEKYKISESTLNKHDGLKFEKNKLEQFKNPSDPNKRKLKVLRYVIKYNEELIKKYLSIQDKIKNKDIEAEMLRLSHLIRIQKKIGNSIDSIIKTRRNRIDRIMKIRKVMNLNKNNNNSIFNGPIKKLKPIKKNNLFNSSNNNSNNNNSSNNNSNNNNSNNNNLNNSNNNNLNNMQNAGSKKKKYKEAQNN